MQIVINYRGPDALPGFRSSGCFDWWLMYYNAKQAIAASPIPRVPSREKSSMLMQNHAVQNSMILITLPPRAFPEK